MSGNENDEIRRRILELLYEKSQQAPTNCEISKQEMMVLLPIPENKLDRNILYLCNKGLITLNLRWQLWESAVINADGIDVVENKEIAEKFPFMQVNLQNSQIFGNVIQSAHSQISFSQQVTDAFKQVSNRLEANNALSIEEKAETEKNLKILQEELQSKNVDLGRLQKSWNWLKQNANWVVPWLTEVVREGIKQVFG